MPTHPSTHPHALPSSTRPYIFDERVRRVRRYPKYRHMDTTHVTEISEYIHTTVLTIMYKKDDREDEEGRNGKKCGFRILNCDREGRRQGKARTRARVGGVDCLGREKGVRWAGGKDRSEGRYIWCGSGWHSLCGCLRDCPWPRPLLQRNRFTRIPWGT